MIVCLQFPQRSFGVAIRQLWLLYPGLRHSTFLYILQMRCVKACTIAKHRECISDSFSSTLRLSDIYDLNLHKTGY